LVSFLSLFTDLNDDDQPLSPAVLIYRVAINKHYATPEEITTWEASHHGRDSVDLERQDKSFIQEEHRQAAGKTTGRVSAISISSTWWVISGCTVGDL
jgi:hypothetical protein